MNGVEAALGGLVLVLLCVVVGLVWVGARRERALRAEIEQVRRELERTKPSSRPADAVKTVLGTALKVRERGIGGAIRSSLDDLAQWADVERPDLAKLAAADGTIAILFSDIEDSTELNHKIGDRAWVALLAKHDQIWHKVVEAYDGHVVKTQGDGFMIAFADAQQAVRAAMSAQRRFARAKRGSRLWGVRVRVGIHTGVVVHRDGDVFGRNVAYAARVADAAAGGEVLVSSVVAQELPDDLEACLVQSRPVQFKGVPGAHRVHQVMWSAGG